MGKPGKNTRKFAKKHLKSVIEKRHKYKPMRDASKRKKAAARAFQSGASKGIARKTRMEAQDQLLKTGGILEKINGDEMMEDDFLDNSNIEDEDFSVEDANSGSDELPSEDENDYLDTTLVEFEDDVIEEEDGDSNALQGQNKTLQSEVDRHKKQLERIQEKDPGFLKFLKEHDKELLESSDEDNIDFEADNESGKNDVLKLHQIDESDKKGMKHSSKKVLTTGVVDAWCQAIMEKQNMGALRCLLRAFQTACHYGDGDKDDSSSNLSIMTSNVFNKIMIFVLCEIDGVFRKLLGLSSSGGKRETILELKDTAQWRNLGFLIKSYLANALHALNQMTDNQMISFTLRRLRSSVIFLAAFPSHLHKFLRVALHFWGSGEGALSNESFLFIRDMTILLGSDCFDSCFRGIYKVFAANCKFVNGQSLQRIQFLQNCVVELYGLDLANAYQHAFVFIHQLGMVLQNALTMKSKEAFQKACSWQYMNCLKLWVKVLCTYTGNNDLQPLLYPIIQIIIGVARLVPTAHYYPLRLQCTKMLNTLAFSRGTFIPVASLLLDMLESKGLDHVPTGGLGEGFEFSTTLKVSRSSLKTRAFQEECVYSVIEQLAEHLAQWSYHVSFPELAFFSLVHLRRFHKGTNIDRFRRQVKQLIDQIERNVEYVERKREEISFSPKDHTSISSFLQAEKESASSPLSWYHNNLRQKADLRKANPQKASVLVKEEESMCLMNNISTAPSQDYYGHIKEGAGILKDWLPEKSNEAVASRKSKKRANTQLHMVASVERDNVVETLESSSDEYDNDSNNSEEFHANDHLPSEREASENGNKKAKLIKASKPLAKSNKHRKNRQSRKKQRLNIGKADINPNLPDQ